MNSLAEPRKWEKLFWPVLASALFLAFWHYSVVWSATKVFPSPLDVGKELLSSLHKKVLMARHYRLSSAAWPLGSAPRP